MSYLAGLLYVRFEQQGATSDLDEGSFPSSATHWNQGNSDRAQISQGDLAISLHPRFLRLGTLSDLDEAVALKRNVLELCPREQPPFEAIR